LRYPPRAALVSLPPQRQPRCEAVRSPLSPRSQVLTFLRSLASTEANLEKMILRVFLRASASPRQAASLELHAIPTQTEQSPSRLVRAIADGGCAPHRKSVERQSPTSNFFPSSFQLLTDLKIGIPPAAMLTSNRRYAYSTPIPHRPNAVSPLRPPNPSAVPPLETSGRSAGLRHKTSRHPRNPKRKRDLSPHGKSPSLLGFASQRPQPRSQPRRPVAVASDGVPRPVKHPSTNSSHLSPAGFWYICLDSNTFIKHVRKEGVW
jgi:hypothetical protein